MNYELRIVVMIYTVVLISYAVVVLCLIPAKHNPRNWLLMEG